MNKLELSRAHQQGEAARRAGKTKGANPYRHRGGADGEALYDRWVDGWLDQDRRNGGHVNANR